MATQRTARLLAFLLVLAAGVGLLRLLDRPAPAESERAGNLVTDTSGACRPGTPGCAEAEAPARPSGPTLEAPGACGSGGYLCAPLKERDTLRIVRFPDHVDLLTIRVPLPEIEEPARARRLQRAAIRGIQVWQGHPFPIRIEEHDRGEPVDMEVSWVRDLRGRQLGRTGSRFSYGPQGMEYRIVSLTLTTRVPESEARHLDPDAVELAAAHEMGHALGLPHSDDRRDLMYPQNTATRPASRDYRTVETLYGLPNGALLVHGGR